MKPKSKRAVGISSSAVAVVVFFILGTLAVSRPVVAGPTCEPDVPSPVMAGCEKWITPLGGSSVEHHSQTTVPFGGPRLGTTPDGAVVLAVQQTAPRACAGDPPERVSRGWAITALEGSSGRMLWQDDYVIRTFAGTPCEDIPTYDIADLAVSPDGRLVSVTGTEFRGGTWSSDNAGGITVVYRVGSGEEVWSSRWDGPDQTGDKISFVRFSRDGKSLYIAGTTGETDTGGKALIDLAVVAYDATAGRVLWQRTWGRAARSFDSLAQPEKDLLLTTLDETGAERVHLMAMSASPAQDPAVFTAVTFDGVTGGLLWATSMPRVGFQDSWPTHAVAAPDGRRLFVAGVGSSHQAQGVIPLRALDAATGGLEWSVDYASEGEPPSEYSSYLEDLAMSLDGSTVVLAGYKGIPAHPNTSAVVAAFDAARGTEKWRFAPHATITRAEQLAVDDCRVVVAAGLPGGSGTLFTIHLEMGPGARPDAFTKAVSGDRISAFQFNDMKLVRKPAASTGSLFGVAQRQAEAIAGVPSAFAFDYGFPEAGKCDDNHVH